MYYQLKTNIVEGYKPNNFIKFLFFISIKIQISALTKALNEDILKSVDDVVA